MVSKAQRMVLKVFRGRFDCKIDGKGRLNLPSTWRQKPRVQRSSPLTDFVITNSQFQKQKYLDIYPLKAWEQLEKRIAALPSLRSEVQAYQRFYLASAQMVSLDAHNRLLISPSLRQYAQLGEEVVMIGMGHKIELWAATRWSELYDGLADQFEDIVAKVADLESRAHDKGDVQ